VEIQSDSDPTNIWVKILGQVFPTDVLLFAEAGEFPEIIAAWQIIMNVALRDDQQKMFLRSTLIVPKVKNEILNQIENATQYLLNQKVNSETRKAEIQSDFSLLEISTFEGEELLRSFEQIPDGSAVGVLYSPFYRFPNIDEQETERIQTWMGINYRIGTAEDIATPHLIELVKRTIPVIQSKNLFVTFFCEFTSFYSKSFMAEFETNDSVMYVQAARGSEKFEELSKIQELIDQPESTDIGNTISQISNISSSPINQAIALSVLYFKKRHFVSAWQTIEPFVESIIESESSTLILSTGQTAFAAGRVEEGKRLFKHAIQLGLNTLEELRHAYMLAKELHQVDLANEILSKMSMLFPTSRTTLSFTFDKLINEKKYGDALDVARQLGNELDIRLCEAFKLDDFKVDDFIEYAKNHGKLEWALLTSSTEAINRNLLELSESLIDRLISHVGFSDESVKIKVFLWTKKFFSIGELSDELANELEPVIKYIAQNPDRISSRSSLQKLFEDEVDEGTALVILTFFLLRSIQSTFHQLDFATLNEKWEQQQLTIPPLEVIEKEHVPLFKSVLETLDGHPIVIGRGEIPSKIVKQIDKKFVGGFISLIQFNALSTDPDKDTLLTMLHVLALACKELNDPISDFSALTLMIGGFAQKGFDQLARDLAETSFLLAENQPEFRYWRYGQAWACYADAHARTRNPLSALLMLNLTFYAWNGEIQNYDKLLQTYRLATRILRDLGFSSFALEILDLEKKIISIRDDKEIESLELEQVRLSVEISELTNQSGVDHLNSLLARSVSILDESIRLNHELTAVLSLQATLFRLLYIAGGLIASDIKERFDSLLAKQEATIAQLLRNISNPFPEKEDLLGALQRASQTNHLDDLVHQLQPIVLVAENSIQAACRSMDADFFLIASAVLSQPGLSIEIALSSQVEYNNILDFSGQAKSWLLSYVNNNNFNHDTQLLEAQGLVEQFLPVRDTFFKQIANLSVTELANALIDNELVVILSEDAAGNLCRLIVSNKSIVGPEVILSNIWSKNNFSIWKKSFSGSLNKWHPPFDLQEEYPSKSDILGSVAQLSVGHLEKNHSLIMAPSSDLSAFPFALSNNEGHHLADVFSVSTIPSVLSLLNSRKNKLMDSRSMKAWLGDPNTFDPTILYVRERLTPIFDAFGVEIINNDSPDELSEASIAFVMSHGGVGLFDAFSGVTDAKHFFSPKDFANRISGCSSTVLFVCGGATGEVERSSPEIRGLTRELLMSKVKAVISSPWSLNANIPEIWLPTFLECIQANLSIGEANFIASQSVKNVFDNPCAWASLQLYGDPAFRVLG
jgi:hypothetical protein